MFTPPTTNFLSTVISKKLIDKPREDTVILLNGSYFERNFEVTLAN